jgi:cobalt/nickel transport protein
MTLIKKLWSGITFLIVLSPLGLIVPDHFHSGAAWGEWGGEEIRTMTGYLPQGVLKFSGLWKAPLPGYAFQGWAGKDLFSVSVAGLISAILGVTVIAGVSLFIGKVLAKEND